METTIEITDAIVAESLYADMVEDSEVVDAESVVYTLEDGRSMLVTVEGEITFE